MRCTRPARRRIKTRAEKLKERAILTAEVTGLVCISPVLISGWLCRRIYKLCKYRYEESELGIYLAGRKELKLERKRWPEPLDQSARIAIEETGSTVSKVTEKEREKVGLFSLPYEIRIQIYEAALELSGWVHVRNESSLAACAPRLYSGTLEPVNSIGCLGILLACRQSYTDVTTLIYSHQIVSIRDIASLLTLSLRLPTFHFNNIRSLQLDAQMIDINGGFLPAHTLAIFPAYVRARFATLPNSGWKVSGSMKTYPYTWHAVCAVLAKMEGLRRLWINLEWATHRWITEYEGPDEFVFQPLIDMVEERKAKGLQGLDSFHVLVNWNSVDEEGDQKDLPFVLTRKLWGDRRRAAARMAGNRTSSSLESEEWVRGYLAGIND